jgi:AbrB family looped-hinge helix DNA binding protein
MKAASPTITKITRNYQVTIPPAARRALNLKVGDFVEATPRGDGVLLRPARVVTDDTFEQELRRRLEEGLADLKAGRTSGPFETADDLVAHLHRIARPSRQRRTRPRR